ncbi:MAG: NDP-sugar synthase [Acidobacteria bacterium]|nr:NDP-sugar synthase [Acidobacteriota bacterium]
MNTTTQVVILAAGLGTRLFPLTLDRPKTLLPVCNAAILKYLLTQLSASGLHSATLCISDTGAAMLDAAAQCAPPGFELTVIHPPSTARGTLESFHLAMQEGACRFLVIYGDSLLRCDFQKVLAAHGENRQRGGLATILFHRPTDLTIPGVDGRTYHGVMSVNPSGAITRFKEKPLIEEVSTDFCLANAAVFVIEKELIDARRGPSAVDFSRDIFEHEATTQPGRLFGLDIGNGFRFDIGSPSRLFEANMKALSGHLALDFPRSTLRNGVSMGLNCIVSSDSTLVPPVLLGDAVTIEPGCQVGPNAILGNECRVASGARITSSLLLERVAVGVETSINMSIIGHDSSVAVPGGVVERALLGAYSSLQGTGRSPHFDTDEIELLLATKPETRTS